ncbi:L,D-transpeptidase family protein [Streptomyces sp. C10-9-1]|uniref:L,D-transpeptidase family protein n=1 Tax=Streptomyces sp. C10-9-1 TaxID=1859285 RepID=UPI003D74E88B
MARPPTARHRLPLAAAACAVALTTAWAPAGPPHPAPGPASSATAFPVPAAPGDARQLITVEAHGTRATVTAWSKGPLGWKPRFGSTGARVGARGVTDGTTRRQGTLTTPAGTYTITEGFGLEPARTRMPYTRVDERHWWVQDPQSPHYNQLRTADRADFPLTEEGERGSEHLADRPVQYALALVIDFNRWPAVPGRGAGIFLHVNGAGATAGCVSVPRETMERLMAWIRPDRHPRIAIG